MSSDYKHSGLTDLNFGPKPQVKRKAFDNLRKGTLSWTEQ